MKKIISPVRKKELKTDRMSLFNEYDETVNQYRLLQRTDEKVDIFGGYFSNFRWADSVQIFIFLISTFLILLLFFNIRNAKQLLRDFGWPCQICGAPLPICFLAKKSWHQRSYQGSNGCLSILWEFCPSQARTSLHPWTTPRRILPNGERIPDGKNERWGLK